MYNRDQLKEKAKTAINKKGAIGPDINLDAFDDAPVQHAYLADEDMCALPEQGAAEAHYGWPGCHQEGKGGHLSSDRH